MAKPALTRRDFLKAAAFAPLVNAVGCCGCGGDTPAVAPAGTARLVTTSALGKSRVVLIRNKEAVGPDRRIDARVVQSMLDDAMTTLFEEKEPVAAWKKIVGPIDTVGIKTNVWNQLPTGPEVESAIRQRLLDAGIPAERIGLRDRGVLNDPLFKSATVLVNARPARVHYWSGMGSCIKNYIQFVPRPSDYHADACADLATIWSLPHVQGRTRLNILVMLTPLYHNIGPTGFSPAYLWTYGGLIVGQDPVAVDATGFRIIQAKRRQAFGEDRPLETSAHHIALADTRHKLGNSDPAKIELIRLGWTQDALI